MNTIIQRKKEGRGAGGELVEGALPSPEVYVGK